MSDANQYSGSQPVESPVEDGPVAAASGIESASHDYSEDPLATDAPAGNTWSAGAGDPAISPGEDISGAATGYTASPAEDSSETMTDVGSGNADGVSNGNGPFSSSGETWDAGYQAGSGGTSVPDAGRAGIHSSPDEPGEQGTISNPERGGSGLTADRVGERAGSPQGTNIPGKPDEERGLESSLQGMAASALSEGGRMISGHNNGLHGSLGMLAASAGSVGMTRVGSSGPGGHSPGGQLPDGASPHRQQQGMPERSGHAPCAPAQTTSLIPEQGLRETMEKEDTARPRSKRERTSLAKEDPDASPVSTPSSPGIPLFPFSLLLFGGYRRISKKNVLEHDTRNSVFHAISSNPGIDVPMLVAKTGINENTLRYHLVKLIESGRVTYLVRPGVIRYFLNQGSFSPAEQLLIHYLWSETPRKIIHLLTFSPGLTRQQISDALGISGPSVTRQMEHLIDDGIIENRVPGRSNHYYLTGDATGIFERMMPHLRAVIENEPALQPVPA